MKNTLIILLLLHLFSCGQSQKIKLDHEGDSVQNTIPISNSKTENIIFAKIDSVSLSQIKQSENKNNQNIFDYYKIETVDEVDIWSDKMFGRCCSNTDLKYSELLNFIISANVSNDTYPSSNLSDKNYRTAYAFKENKNVKIFLKLNRNSEYHIEHTKLSVDEVLRPNDTLLQPFKLSLVNGYVKSEKTFKENGRVKTMEVFLNNKNYGIVVLKDTPVVQEFEINMLFTRDDVIQLVPKSYYLGTKYDDICISEIQSSLSEITCSSFDEKFSVRGGSYTYFGDYVIGSSGEWDHSVLGYDQVEIREDLKPVEKMIWKAYYHNCRLACKVEYHNGKLMNVLSYFDENGNVLDKGSIKDGNGVLKEYDKNSELIKEIIFSNGLIVDK